MNHVLIYDVFWCHQVSVIPDCDGLQTDVQPRPRPVPAGPPVWSHSCARSGRCAVKLTIGMGFCETCCRNGRVVDTLTIVSVSVTELTIDRECLGCIHG